MKKIFFYFATLFIIVTFLGCTKENYDEKITLEDEGKFDSNESASSDLINEKNKLLANLEKVTPKRIEDYIMVIEGKGECERQNDGIYAGWESELFDGCGWWCTVESARQEVDASSTLRADGYINYSSLNLNDMSRNNSWVEGVDGDGIGEYVELTKQFICFDGDKDGGSLGEICIVTGYAQNEKLWNENNRVKTLLMYLNGKPYKYIELTDTINPQYFYVWDEGEYGMEIEPSQEIKLKFEIVDIYKGTKYNDTAITYLDVAFNKGH